MFPISQPSAVFNLSESDICYARVMEIYPRDTIQTFRPREGVHYASHPGWSETGAILPFLCRKVGRKAGQLSEVQEYRNPGSGSLTLQPSRIFIPLSLCPLYLLGRGLLRLSDKVIREYRPFPAMKNDSTLQMSPAISILSSNIPSPSGPE